MASSDDFEPAKAFQFNPGTATDSPILVPLPAGDGDLPSMMHFCRRACPGAPLLTADIGRLSATINAGDLPSPDLIAGRLALVIIEAVRAHDLFLVPLIVVGHAEGADLAVRLSMAHGQLLGACILLGPTAPAPPPRADALHGVHILLVRKAAEEAVGTIGWQVRDVLKQSGAEIICERAPDLTSLGPAEVAIAHVFVAALFGA